MEDTFGVLILAGGQSQRMNYPKPFLMMKGKTFLENIIKGYINAGIGKISVVLNQQLLSLVPGEIGNYKQVRITPNDHPEAGRFYSLLIGLSDHVNEDYTFIHNIDNPFVKKSVLKDMMKHREPGGYVVPMYNGRGGHPVLLARKVIMDIVADNNVTDSLRNVLSKEKRIEVQTNTPEILVNINTRKDYEHHVPGQAHAYSE